jgi:hypothetical protein
MISIITDPERDRPVLIDDAGRQLGWHHVLIDDGTLDAIGVIEPVARVAHVPEHYAQVIWVLGHAGCGWCPECLERPLVAAVGPDHECYAEWLRLPVAYLV